MNKLFYLKLAISNIKKNRQTYIPYMIMCMMTIMMFYIMHAISIDEGILNYSNSLSEILSLGVIVSGIFSTIILFYTNSFLIKRRTKEIGLYNILGLEKKHIAIMLVFENIIIYISTLVFGLISGMVLNKLMFLLLLKLLKMPIEFGFTIPIKSILLTMVVFLGIFLLTMLSNLIHIKLSKPIELLKGGEFGEKEPKSKWILASLGVIALSTGYTIALRVDSPTSAISLFLIAVILVMIGTYAIFTAGSIIVLKLLRKNKKFYYKTRNFISISSMIYRMKQNAVGLANICILSTAVLVMLSGTVALYIGMEDAVRTRFPKDVVIIGEQFNNDDKIKINSILNEQIQKSNLNIKHKVDYSSSEYLCLNKGGKFIIEDNPIFEKDICMLYTIPVSDYNRLEGKNITLEEDDLILFSINNKYRKEQVIINDIPYDVKAEINEFELASNVSQNLVDSYVLIVNDIDVLGETEHSNYIIGFDSDSSYEEIILFTEDLNQITKDNNIIVSINSAAANREAFLEITGGLFFMGIFLGTLFLMATVMIIYYKQISEGFDDKDRFNIIQKVGISKHEVKNTIRSQVLLMFFLPLIFTIIHIAVAFPIITKLLAILYLTNTQLYLITTIISIMIFSIVYGIVFLLTARTYYKIVNQ